MFLWLRRIETRGRSALPDTFLRMLTFRFARISRRFLLVLIIVLHLCAGLLSPCRLTAVRPVPAARCHR